MVPLPSLNSDNQDILAYPDVIVFKRKYYTTYIERIFKETKILNVADQAKDGKDGNQMYHFLHYSDDRIAKKFRMGNNTCENWTNMIFLQF